jgi:hypothetical protein
MGIDGTWRRTCILTAVSEIDAVLTVESSINGLNLKEFFLLLSSTGLAYRRCELARVNGDMIEVNFIKASARNKRHLKDAEAARRDPAGDYAVARA